MEPSLRFTTHEENNVVVRARKYLVFAEESSDLILFEDVHNLWHG